MKEEFSTKGQTWFSEERMLFSTEYAGKFGLPFCQNKSFDLYLVLFTKINSKIDHRRKLSLYKSFYKKGKIYFLP